MGLELKGICWLTARALVLDLGHGALRAPIDGVRGLGVGVPEGRVPPRPPRAVDARPGELTPELLVGEVGEPREPELVARGALSVPLDVVQILLPDVEPALPLLRAPVDSPVLAHPGGKLVRQQRLSARIRPEPQSFEFCVRMGREQE